MSKFTTAFRELGSYKELLRSQVIVLVQFFSNSSNSAYIWKIPYILNLIIVSSSVLLLQANNIKSSMWTWLIINFIFLLWFIWNLLSCYWFKLPYEIWKGQSIFKSFLWPQYTYTTLLHFDIKAFQVDQIIPGPYLWFNCLSNVLFLLLSFWTLKF